MKEGESLRALKERAIELLQAGYASDRLDMDEFERRLDLVTTAESARAVKEVVADLRQIEEAADPPERRDDGRNQRILSILSERMFSGDWLVGAHASSIAVLGSTRLDLRDTATDKTVVSLHVVAVMGETRIIVPPDMRVENDITPILAEVRIQAPRARETRGRTLRLSGFAVMGEVRVEVRK
ncbi:MAG: DUF1707 SHOCT-like domain-containing protein [Alkalispirochaetaceae bacterium]